MRKIILILMVVLFILSCEKPEAERVILLGIDALSTDGLQSATTPNLNRLIKDGALSLKARGVMPTVSAPNWGSMLTGAGPEQHGITKNGWTTDNFTIEATVKDEDGYFPSIFNLIKRQRPEYKTAIIFDWKELLDLYNENYIDHVEYLSSFEEVYDNSIKYIRSDLPEFAFIYAGHVDEIGHKDQHGSIKYYNAIEELDAKIGELLNALDSAGLYESTTIIVISDHGGVGYGHGGESMAEIQVPWIIKGPGIIKNALIEEPMNTYDTAPTISYLFGIEQHDHWIGRPVFGAFNIGYQSSSPNNKRYVAKPYASVKSGIHSEAQELSFSVDTKDAQIRYTVDGTDPNENSNLYEESIILDKTITIKAVSILNNNKSNIETVDFMKVLNVSNCQLLSDPSPKYPAEFGSNSLIDGILGSDDYLNEAWVGFEADDMVAVIDLGSSKSFSRISLSCLKNEYSWIFLPKIVEFYASNNNRSYNLIGTIEEYGIQSTYRRKRRLINKNFEDKNYRYIKIIAKNIKYCPEHHIGAGGKAWLFVDEIIIE